VIDRAREDFCALETPEARAALAERQLAALAEREPQVRAFVCLDSDEARRQIAKHRSGPLAGALVGIKDIIATSAFPTRYGSSHPAVVGPRADAWCVLEARRLGGIILGKTVCTEFAYPLPGPTTNPHDPLRTPGGSSSGSAAAVAAGFVSFALGTQTAGSTIRPASYCGITGFKPSYGLLHLEGVQAISSTCDHLGIFAHSPRDAWYFVSAMIATRAEIVAPRPPQRLLRLELPAEITQTDDYPERIDALVQSLRQAGVTITAMDLPFPIDAFKQLQQELCYWEAARILMAPGVQHLVPELRALLAPYLEVDLSVYAAARRRRQAYQAQFEALTAGYDAVLSPAATGIAPPLASTGDAVMSRFWTVLHVPAITVPMWRSVNGMPLGLQLLGRIGEDKALAEIAQWFHFTYTQAQ
jgi:Asp-tRNA(Asn)/Glu-tRNA(Gln) amidotransferase A subunit family amidase